MKTCCRCKTPKSLDEFGNNKSQVDGKQLYCLECSRRKDKGHYQSSRLRRRKLREAAASTKIRNSQFILEYLKDHPCMDCGESDPVVLEFDHVRGKKRTNVSTMMTYSLPTIEREMAKCVVRCANCHRRKTAKERGYYKHLIAGMM